MLINMTLKEFLAELKSNSPAPGGGSVAALAGALGASLALMVGNLTSENAKYQEVHEEVKGLQTRLEEQLTRLEKYIDEDTAVFNEVMAAYRLPKGSEEEKLIRTQEIQNALQKAARLPMSVATLSQEVLALARRMLEIGNINAASDAAVAGRMAHTAMWGAIYNVRINLGSIKDRTFISEMRQQIEAVLQKADIEMANLLQEVDRKIGA